MALLNKKLTPPEIAAIYYHVFGNCSDWMQLYAIADGIKVSDIINRSTVYKWKNSAKIVDLIRQLNRAQSDTIETAINKAMNDAQMAGVDNVHTNNETRPKKAGFVDFSRPENQTAKLNELVNTADDPGEALDALKVIMQAQKADRDAAKDGRIVRAYVPVSCHECPIYQKAGKKA